MRALLDILYDERNLVREIEQVEDTIESRTVWRERLREIGPDCQAKYEDLAIMLAEIERLRIRKYECEDKLRAIRREIASHISGCISL